MHGRWSALPTTTDQRSAAAAALGLAAIALAGVAEPWFVEPAARVAALGTAGWTIRRRLLPDLVGAEAALASFVFASALAVTCATLLGVFGWLSGGAANVLLAGALGVLALLRRSDSGKPTGERDGPSPPPPCEPVDRREAFAVALVVGIAVSTLVFDTRSLLTRPPGAFGHDDLSYHLTTAATFRQWGDLRSPKPSFGDRSTAFYPVAGELVAWWLLAPGKGVDYLARWSELPAAAALLLAGFALGRRLGLSRAATALGVSIVLTVPRIYPELAHSAGNDLWTALALLATLHGASLLRRVEPAAGALYLGSALGLLIGAKYLGLVYAAVAVAVAAICGWIRASRWLIAAPGVATAVGGVTYLRNFAGTGNPIYPQPVRLLGLDLLPGVEGADLLRRVEEGSREFQPLSFLLERSDLFGPVFAWTVLPAAVLAPVVAAFLSWGGREAGAARTGRAFGWLLLPAVLYAVFVTIVHDHRDLRYIAAAPVLAALALAWLLDRLGARVAAPVALLGIGAVTSWVLATRAESRFGERLGATVGLAVLLGAATFARSPERARIARAAAGVLAAVLAVTAFGSGSHLERYLDRRLLNRPDAEALERLTGGRPTVVAVAGSNQEYPFLGRHLQNRLEPLPTPPRLEDRFWSLGRSPATVAVQESGPGLVGRLERLEVELLVVRRGPAVRGLERDLVRARGWRVVEEHRDWRFWRRIAGGGTRRREHAQGSTRLHQEVVPDSKPSE